MTEINFTEGDVGKWVFNTMLGKWEKIIGFNDDARWPVETNNDLYFTDGLSNEKDKLPAILPADHPAVLAGRLEILIPPPPRKKVVLEPGWYLQHKNGSIIKTTLKIHPNGYYLFEITEPVTLTEGDK